jgi:hypothetical protein
MHALKHSDYFALVQEVASEAEAQQLLALGRVQFVINLPVDFARRLVRGERPAVLVEADATDPSATSNAIAAFYQLLRSELRRELRGPLAELANRSEPVEWRVHRIYNEEGVTPYHVVPGLVGVVLTMTMVIITALAITRERERGTVENLLSTIELIEHYSTRIFSPLALAPVICSIRPSKIARRPFSTSTRAVSKCREASSGGPSRRKKSVSKGPRPWHKHAGRPVGFSRLAVFDAFRFMIPPSVPPLKCRRRVGPARETGPPSRWATPRGAAPSRLR